MPEEKLDIRERVSEHWEEAALDIISRRLSPDNPEYFREILSKIEEGKFKEFVRNLGGGVGDPTLVSTRLEKFMELQERLNEIRKEMGLPEIKFVSPGEQGTYVIDLGGRRISVNLGELAQRLAPRVFKGITEQLERALGETLEHIVKNRGKILASTWEQLLPDDRIDIESIISKKEEGLPVSPERLANISPRDLREELLFEALRRALSSEH